MFATVVFVGAFVVLVWLDVDSVGCSFKVVWEAVVSLFFNSVEGRLSSDVSGEGTVDVGSCWGVFETCESEVVSALGCSFT